MKETRFICFASYKGGVGRSLALANTAYLLARAGRKVLIIDFDLEAPGQHLTDLFKRNTLSPGLLELIGAFRFHFESDDTPDDVPFSWDVARYMQRSITFEELSARADADMDPSGGEPAGNPAPAQRGELWLMRSGGLDSAYYEALHQLDWAEFYEVGHGEEFFKALKAKLRLENFDDVLIDARTGLSDVFMISTLTLGETIVLVSGLQNQHAEGLTRVLHVLRGGEDKYGRKKVLVVLSPVPDLPPDERRRREDELRQNWPALPRFDVEIPYYWPLFLHETILTYQNDALRLPGPAASLYVTRMNDLCQRLDTPGLNDGLAKLAPSNPFAVIRSDYPTAAEWSRYFVDPGHRIIEGVQNFMPCIVSGARGSGKTMLARQLSFETTVEKFRIQGQPIDIASVSNIGLYLKIDRDELGMFDTDNPEHRPIFDRLFSQFIDLVILRKALAGLEALGGVTAWCRGQQRDLFAVLARELGLGGPAPETLSALLAGIDERLCDIRIYLNNPLHCPSPFMVRPGSVLRLLTDRVFTDSALSDRYLIVMFDEYEYMRKYQQKMINMRMKQVTSASRMTYKFFIRTNGLRTWATTAEGQPIQRSHDFRPYSLDEGLDYNTFLDYLKRIANRHIEMNPYFKSSGWQSVDDLFASLSPEEEAAKVAATRNQDELRAWVRKSHQASSALIEAWFAQEPSALRRATAVTIINQGKDPRAVIEAFSAWTPQARDWYHNYHRGALFWLYHLHRRPKVYAGFSDIAGISGYNVRTGLDLCFAIIEDWVAQGEPSLPISTDIQTTAIQRQALAYRNLIYTSDSSAANQMLTFCDRLGRMFRAIHEGPRQSEPEVNHFFVKGVLSEEIEAFLGLCYSEEILRRVPERKQKDLTVESQVSWQLHPRLAPRYLLSWRLKKNITLTADEVMGLCKGDDAWWRAFQSRFVRRQESLGGRDAAQGDLGL